VVLVLAIVTLLPRTVGYHSDSWALVYFQSSFYVLIHPLAATQNEGASLIKVCIFALTLVSHKIMRLNFRPCLRQILADFKNSVTGCEKLGITTLLNIAP